MLDLRRLLYYTDTILYDTIQYDTLYYTIRHDTILYDIIRYLSDIYDIYIII